jgi:hypothetical protein
MIGVVSMGILRSAVVIRPDARHNMTLKERPPIAKTRFLVSGGWSNFLADREFTAFKRRLRRSA